MNGILPRVACATSWFWMQWREVPREIFLPKRLREFAYEDSPLPIEGEQTISQPYIVAFMTEALMLKGGEKILEIGAGSGYAAAVLSEIAAIVYTVERLGPLAEKAAETLAELGYDNVHVLHGDGTRGWPDQPPMMPLSWPPADRRCRSLSRNN